MNMTDMTEKLAKGRSGLSELEFSVVHQISMKLQAADALSRTATKENDDTLSHDDVPVLPIPE